MSATAQEIANELPQPEVVSAVDEIIDTQLKVPTGNELQFSRRIYAEDPEWNVLPIKKLGEMCIDAIVRNFDSRPILDKLIPKHRNLVLSKLPLSLPLALATEYVPETVSDKLSPSNYWHRRATSYFKNCDVRNHGGSWKRLYFERMLEDMIERYIPPVGLQIDPITQSLKPATLVNLPKHTVSNLLSSEQKESDRYITDIDEIVKIMKIGSNYVRRLNVKQLRSNEDDAVGNHIELRNIFENLSRLEELSLYYGIHDCGINFDWKFFGMTVSDCNSLCSCLRASRSLKSLRLQSCGIDDNKIHNISQALNGSATISVLDLSNNAITDTGAKYLADTLQHQDCSIRDLDLSNNRISDEGIELIGIALSSQSGKNTSLETLKLSLNQITDAGAERFLMSLKSNTSLSTLDFSANTLGMKTVNALAALFMLNVSSGLRNIFLNCIHFNDKHSYFNRTDPAGKLLLDSISVNKHIINLDLRSTDILEENVQGIQSICKE